MKVTIVFSDYELVTHGMDRIFQSDPGVTIYDEGTVETGTFYPWHRILEIRLIDA